MSVEGSEQLLVFLLFPVQDFHPLFLLCLPLSLKMKVIENPYIWVLTKTVIEDTSFIGDTSSGNPDDSQGFPHFDGITLTSSLAM